MLNSQFDLTSETAFAPASIDHVHAERQIMTTAVAAARQQIDRRIDRQIALDMLFRIIGPESAQFCDLSHAQRRDRLVIASV